MNIRSGLGALLLSLCTVVFAQEAPRDLKTLMEDAEDGEIAAQFELGNRYLSGDGVEADNFEAARWFRMAAEQGHIAAMFSMAAMHETGEGLEQNYEEAFRWYRMAAGQGHPSSQNNLGLMYEAGQGVAANPVRAYAWLKLAAQTATGVEKERFMANRDQLEATLSSEQLQEGSQLSDQCLESRYRECE